MHIEDEDIHPEDLMDLEDGDGSSANEQMDSQDDTEEDLQDSESEDKLADGQVRTFYKLNLAYSNESLVARYTGSDLAPGTTVIVPTRFGRDMARIVGTLDRPRVAKSDIVDIEGVASEDDLARARDDREKERDAYRICKEKISAHKLDMKLVAVHYLLDETKILFFFTAENRVDFRELVKDLVAIFKHRIELRQIGVRDEARVVGGLGVCGRAYCCHSVSDKLKPVSIKMAKDQNLSLNSMKISGPCGRLLCCLAYEHNFYQEARRNMPSEGYRLNWDGTNWKTTEVNPVSGRIRLHGEDGRSIDLPGSLFERVDGRWLIRKEAKADDTDSKNESNVSGKEIVDNTVNPAPDIGGM